jgi:hypothetical protein
MTRRYTPKGGIFTPVLRRGLLRSSFIAASSPLHRWVLSNVIGTRRAPNGETPSSVLSSRRVPPVQRSREAVVVTSAIWLICLIHPTSGKRSSRKLRRAEEGKAGAVQPRLS